MKRIFIRQLATAIATYLTKMPHGRRYTSFMLKAIVFVYVISRVVCNVSEEMEPARGVSRRLGRDIIYYESRDEFESCDNENHTYLVDERQCVNNTELINGNNLINKLKGLQILIFVKFVQAVSLQSVLLLHHQFLAEFMCTLVTVIQN